MVAQSPYDIHIKLWLYSDVCFVPMDHTSHTCCLQAAEAEKCIIGRDKLEKKKNEKKERPKSQTIEHVTPDLSQLEPPPFVVGAAPAAATPGHIVEPAGEHSDEILPALLHNALYVV